MQDWPDLEAIWQHVYSKLTLNPRNQGVVLTEPPLSPTSQRASAAELLFEGFSVPGLFVGVQSVLSLYAQGTITGVVLECGDGLSHCVPVYDGFAVPQAIIQSPLAGFDVTNHLMLLLRRAGYAFHPSADFELVQQLKEASCYIAAGDSMCESVSHALPDGRTIDIEQERWRAAEILFSPEKLGLECLGVQDCVLAAIQATDIDLRAKLYSSICLSGGSTLLPHFGQRLLNDLRARSPKEIKIKISAATDRATGCWQGAARLSTLSEFATMWVTRQEYQEQGERVLHTRML